MKTFGCPERFISIIRQFHAGMEIKIAYKCNLSGVLPVSNGKKQECFLALTLFSVMLSATLIDVFETRQGGLKLNYRTVGGLFNTSSMKATPKVNTDRIRELLHADDCALCAYNEPDMQQVVEDFSAACENFGFTINTEKTEVIYQLVPGKPHEDLNIMIGSDRLRSDEAFTFFGSVFFVVATTTIK